MRGAGLQSILTVLDEDVPGFCKSATLAEIVEHGHIPTPGRYIGAQAVADDEEAFAEKMANLSLQLREQFAQSDALNAEIKRNLAGLGYEI
jgi:type I restriction enzyme M protein